MNTEHVDIGLARYSDWAFTSSVVVLVAALLLLAVELAYSRGRKVETRELVGAAVGADSATPGVVVDTPKRPLDERVGLGDRGHVRLGLDREVDRPEAVHCDFVGEIDEPQRESQISTLGLGRGGRHGADTRRADPRATRAWGWLVSWR